VERQTIAVILNELQKMAVLMRESKSTNITQDALDNPLKRFPELGHLTAALTCALKENGIVEGPITTVNRRPNLYSSSYPSQIVTCKSGSGKRMNILCKFGGKFEESPFNHRGSVFYETEVYRRLLSGSHSTVPKFYGSYSDETTGGTWLFIEYLDRSMRVSKSSDPKAIPRASRWIASFQRTNESLCSDIGTLFLRKHGAHYFAKWAQQTSQFASPALHRRFPWLKSLCSAFGECVGILATGPQTIIHGEFYAQNILIQCREIRVVDWQSAAVAAGEIDLAALTDSWSSQIIQECESEYERIRWPDAAPADFRRRLGLARMYWLFRWLGQSEEWTRDSSLIPRFQQLRAEGEQLGLL
jgi:hypothetical protein